MIRDQKSNKHIAHGYKKLFRAFKREAVQFLVAKTLAVSHLTLEALPAVQTWIANCKSDRKTVVTRHFVVCGLRFSTRNLMLKVSNVEETGTSKLRKSNSFNNKKSFAQRDGRDANTHEEKLRAHTTVTQYRRHCQLALGEAKRFPSAESSLREKKTIYPPSARNVQRKQNAFSRITKRVTFEVWKCELPLVKLKCFVQNVAWSKKMFFLQALMGDTEKSKKTKKNYYLFIRVKYFFTTQRSWSWYFIDWGGCCGLPRCKWICRFGRKLLIKWPLVKHRKVILFGNRFWNGTTGLLKRSFFSETQMSKGKVPRMM